MDTLQIHFRYILDTFQYTFIRSFKKDYIMHIIIIIPKLINGAQ